MSKPSTPAVGAGKKSYSTDQLRNFYFSKATNYAAFDKKKDAAATDLTPPRNRAATPSDVDISVRTAGSAQHQDQVRRPQTQGAAGGVRPTGVTAAAAVPSKKLPTPVPDPSAVETSTSHQLPSTSPVVQSSVEVPSTGSRGGTPTTSAPPRGSAVAAVKTTRGSSASAAQGTTAVVEGVSHAGDTVSPEYIKFLRQQQDLVKTHHQIGEVVAVLLNQIADCRKDYSEGLGVASSLLHSAEGSTDWHWKSKFNIDQLFRDAGLLVPVDELSRADDVPNVVDIQHQHQQLIKLRQEHCSGGEHPAYKLTLENGIRRFDRLLKECSASQVDASPLIRTSDDLLVHLDHLLSIAPLKQVLQDVNDSIQVLLKKQRECVTTRDSALEDGEMSIAERESYRLIDLGEELAATEVEKIRVLTQKLEETVVSQAVRDAYHTKAGESTSVLEAQAQVLRKRCEDDLAKLYQLKRSIDDTEVVLAEKWRVEQAASETRLNELGVKQAEIWDQIIALVKQLRPIEIDRHAEIKLRMEEKVKDETRRIEYAAFCAAAEQHAATLDRTMRNCDTNLHCTKLMDEFLQNGFYTIQKDLTDRKREIEESLLVARKSHLDVFRNLLFTLSDLEYKKERHVDEVGENVQAAHIQQELCADSLNPNAKKFSDAKKDLLKLRDDLELQVHDIRNRMSAAVSQFRPTEQALAEANITFPNPIAEMEDRRLVTRAKMVEYRAMSLGTVSSDPIMQELESLKKGLDESRKLIANRSHNATSPGKSTSGINTSSQGRR